MVVPGVRPPLRPKIFSILCSFSEYLAKSYVAPLPGGLAPPPTGNPGSAPGRDLVRCVITRDQNTQNAMTFYMDASVNFENDFVCKILNKSEPSCLLEIVLSIITRWASTILLCRSANAQNILQHHDE